VTLTLRLEGDSDAGLRAAYADAAALVAAAVLLDFTDAAYINSTGIALIVRLLADARRDHREVRAAGLSRHYLEIFRITRLSDYVQILDEPSNAVAADAATANATDGER